MVTVELTNATTLTMRKGAASNYGYVWGFVVQFETGVIKKKETVDMNFGVSQTKVNALSNIFRTAHSLILPCGLRTADSTAITDSLTLEEIFFQTAFTSISAGLSSEITSSRDGSGVDNVISHIQIVEMDVL